MWILLIIVLAPRTGISVETIEFNHVMACKIAAANVEQTVNGRRDLVAIVGCLHKDGRPNG